jgi:hypothetical protein
MRGLTLAALLVAACGSGPSTTSQRGIAPAPGGAPPPPGVAPPAPGAPVAGAAGAIFTYPKVPDKYRLSFTPDMFENDPSGDHNRDPFRSFIVEDTTQTTNKPGEQHVDECKNRTVAEQYGLRDLRLAGIVKKGTIAYAMFIDTQGIGHVAKRGDCLSKDKARMKEIGTQSITVEIRPDPAPGQAAPAPREEEWKLHPEAMDLTPEGLSQPN